MSQTTHYIPEWLLWKFRQPLLYELDIFTGATNIRNPKKAGSGQDLWPEDIENGLTVHDTQAARIYRNKIAGQTRIALSDAEQFDFALWLSQFYIRIPATREDFRRMLEEEKKSGKTLLDVVAARRADILKFYREKLGQNYLQAVAEIGKAAIDEFLMEQFIAHALCSDKFPWPEHEKIHHVFMRNNRSHEVARRLCQYDWNWLKSRYQFVIGDNPLVRWDLKSGRWNIGVNRQDVEITMPLELHLCLRLNQGPRIRCESLQDCDETLTRLYNCRQRLAAVKYVYGSSPEALDFIKDPIVGWSPESE
jgi:hypothetical protein